MPILRAECSANPKNTKKAIHTLEKMHSCKKVSDQGPDYLESKIPIILGKWQEAYFRKENQNDDFRLRCIRICVETNDLATSKQVLVYSITRWTLDLVLFEGSILEQMS